MLEKTEKLINTCKRKPKSLCKYMLEKTEKLINTCKRNPNAETQVTLSNRHRTKQDTLNRKI